ncbi:monocarboxylate transporter 12-B-like isoform X1 [Panulirus ornatus]|uniref:monocarboxylate transporter 12-B-like isoform X1 n=2 Tax=Panulirus ornatus TaxID=150431 RepID=UPI003A85B47B
MTNAQETVTTDNMSDTTRAAKITEVRCNGGVQCAPTKVRQYTDARVNGKGIEGEVDDAAWEMRPPDGGWGWMVALGSFIITTLLPMLGPCFGVLFSRYLLQEGSSSTTTAWIFNTQSFIWNIMGVVTRPLTQEFGWRRVGIFGSILVSVSMIASAFTPYPEFLFFSFSLISGAGGGAVVCMCFTVIPLYFDRRRGLANGIMMAGVCMGQIVGPPLARLLQDEFGFTGATLILGGIILHSCVGVSFFHPVEWHMKRSPAQVVSQTQEGSLPLISQGNGKLSVREGLVISHSEMSFSESLCEVESGVTSEFMLAKNLGIVSRPLRSSYCTLRNNSTLALSTLDIASNAAMQDTERNDDQLRSDEDDETRCWSICSVLLRVIHSTISDLGVLRSPRACILAFGGTFCINGYLNFMMMVPFAMQAAGHTLEASAWCLSSSAISNLLMRLMVSSLSDWSKFNMRACHMAGFGIISFTIFIFPFLSDLTHLLVTMALFGCGVGATMGLYNLVMIDVMGLENLAPVFGACCFMVAVGFICLGPLIGFVRDVSNSYALSMWVLAGMLLTSFTLWLFMPAAVRYDQRRLEEKEQQEPKKV